MPVLVALLVGSVAPVGPASGGPADTTKDRLTVADRAAAPPPALLVHFERQRQASYALSLSTLAGDGASDTTRRRQRALAVSDGYATRLKIHQIGAFVMLPLVASEFVIGQKLINSTDRPDGLRTAHKAVAVGIGTVFGVNTITGALNWWETRKDPTGRTRRTLHSLLMLASDAGFLWAAASAGGAQQDLGEARHHRAIAEVSISLSLASTLMMWLWKG